MRLSRLRGGRGPPGPQRSGAVPRDAPRPESPDPRSAPRAGGATPRERSLEHGDRPSPGSAGIRPGRGLHAGIWWRDAGLRLRIAHAAGDRPVPSADPGAVCEAAFVPGPRAAPMLRPQTVLDEPEPSAGSRPRPPQAGPHPRPPEDGYHAPRAPLSPPPL